MCPPQKVLTNPGGTCGSVTTQMPLLPGMMRHTVWPQQNCLTCNCLPPELMTLLHLLLLDWYPCDQCLDIACKVLGYIRRAQKFMAPAQHSAAILQPIVKVTVTQCLSDVCRRTDFALQCVAVCSGMKDVSSCASCLPTYSPPEQDLNT